MVQTIAASRSSAPPEKGSRAVSTVIRWMRVATAAAMALIVMGELDRLISAVANTEGHTHSLGAVVGPLSIAARDAWADWALSDLRVALAGWITLHTLVDALLVVCYAAAGFAFLARWSAPPTPTPPTTQTTGIPDPDANRPRTVLRPRTLVRALWVVVGFEAVEFVLLTVASLTLAIAGPAPVTATAIAVVALLKWAAVVVFVVLVLRHTPTRRALARAVRRGWQAVWVQRLSVVGVVTLGIMSCVPTDGVLDQLPDVQRQWLTTHSYQAVTAVVAVAVAFLAAFALGRARARLMYARYVPPRQEPVEVTLTPVVWWWMLPIAAWLIIAVLGFLLSGGRDVFGLGPLIAFPALPALVLLSSGIALLWVRPPHRSLPPLPAPGADPPRALYARLTGDVLAIAVISVAALGLVRSTAAPTFLQLIADAAPADPAPDTPDALAGAPIDLVAPAVLVLATAIALTAPRLLRTLDRRRPDARRFTMAGVVAANDPTEPRVPPGSSPAATAAQAAEWRRHRRWLLGFIGGGATVLVLLTLWPQVAGLLGPTAAMVLILTCWTAIFGGFAVALQDYAPLPIFRMLRLTATPVLTLGLVVPFVWGAVFGVLSADGQPHLIRTLPTATPANPTAEGPDDASNALVARLGANRCTVTVGEQQIRPVLLVAAEGGGIRAAYWTAKALERILGASCLDQTVLVSSGVSGGSVGLVLSGLVDDPAAMSADLAALASPDTLGMAVSGLLAGDVIASATGVKLPSYIAPPPDFDDTDAAARVFEWRWRDRAALIETGWIAGIHSLAEPYEVTAKRRTGVTLLNSTDVDSGCRVVVGDQSVVPTPYPAAPTPDPADAPRCDDPTTDPAVTWWPAAECLAQLDRATAAMLSARFPIVTPGGRLPEGECDGRAQLIDGGYAEGSGLGTLADLGPQIAAAVRERNEAASSPYVPIVVYLRNSAGFDVAETLENLTAEPLVPLVGYGARATQLSDWAWLQRVSASIRDVCAPFDSPCEQAVQAVRDAFANQIVVVSAGTRPSVVPPLGWALSAYSADSMDRALQAEADCETPGSADGAARLCRLLDLDPAP